MTAPMKRFRVPQQLRQAREKRATHSAQPFALTAFWRTAFRRFTASVLISEVKVDTRDCRSAPGGDLKVSPETDQADISLLVDAPGCPGGFEAR
jgi:hypothetical protein